MYGSPAIRSKSTLIAWAAIPWALVIIAVVSSTAEASILQTGVMFGTDEALTLVGQGAGVDSASAARESTGNAPHQVPSDDTLLAPFALDNGVPTPNGSTSSSSSTSTSTGVGAMCTLCSEVVVISDDTSTRLAVSQTLALPAPPSVSLLRPPRA